MPVLHVSPQEMSIILSSGYCAYAACVILVYDWLLCLGQEVRFIWSWHSKVNGSSLLYAFSRYAILIKVMLVVATTSPMSDLSCRAVVWTQIITEILGGIAFSAFSALRAYALSNRSTWLAGVIFVWVLPPSAMLILQCFYQAPANFPSPLNCSSSSSLPPALAISFDAVLRGSQLVGELLVVGITWWYTYQSYRIRKGIDLGKTVSSLLVYNGSVYFVFLASLYIIAIVFNTATVPEAVVTASSYMLLFYDPIASILTCRFILSLRQFDNTVADATTSGPSGRRAQEHTGLGDMLQFAAQPSDSLPSFIASFAHPVHVDSALSETDSDDFADDGSEWREMDVVAPTQNLEDAAVDSSHTDPAPDQLPSQASSSTSA